MKIFIPKSTNIISLIFILRAIGMIFGFIYLSTLTKSLGIEESGKYFFYLSIITIFLSICLFGLPTYFEQNLPKYIQFENQSILFSAIKSSLIFAISIAFGVVILSVFFIKFKIIHLEVLTSSSFYKFLLAIPIMTLTSLFSKIIQVSGKNIISILISNFLFSFIYLILVLLTTPKNIDSFINIFLVCNLILLIISLFFLPYKNFYKNHNKVEIFPILKKSFNFFLIGIVYEYGMQLTTLFLGAAGNNSDISAYAICIKISSIISFALLAVHHFYISQFSSSIDQFKKSIMKNLIIKSLSNLFILALPIFFFIFIFRKKVLSFFGQEFIEFDFILVINLISYLVYSIGGIAVMYLISARLEKKMLQNSVVVFILASILNYLFVYKHGIIAGVLIFLLTNIFLTFFNYFYVYKHYQLLDK